MKSLPMIVVLSSLYCMFVLSRGTEAATLSQRESSGDEISQGSILHQRHRHQRASESYYSDYNDALRQIGEADRKGRPNVSDLLSMLEELGHSGRGFLKGSRFGISKRSMGRQPT